MIFTVTAALLTCIDGYAGSTGIGTFATSTAANIFANLATDWMKSLCRFGDDTFLRTYKGIDENHVVISGVRTAQLDALAAVLRRFDAARQGHRDPAKENFAELLHEFLPRERKLVSKLRFEGPPEATEAEKQLRRDLVALLPDATSAALAARHGPAGAAAERERFRRACEEAVLGELRALVFDEIPPLFLSAFQGNRDRADGWFDLFFRSVAGEMKKGGQFAQIWQAEQVAAIAYATGAAAEQSAATMEAVQAIRNGLIAHGTALSALAGEVEAVREHVAAVHARTIGDAAMPLDFEARVDTAGHLRFAPRNPLVPFFGRGSEMDALRSLLGTPPDFAWWLLCGSGGAGKTRLCLRLAMLAHAEGWRAGFLPKSYAADMNALDAWQPQRPTLIVVDYTLKRRDAVRVVADRLARRAGNLPQPVRLLLIEREGGASFDAQFLGADSQGVINPHRHADPFYGPELALPPLAEDDLWALAQGGRWHPAPRELPLSRNGFFAWLDELDEERRPLVAMILADAASAEPGRPAFDSLTAELQRLLERDRRDLWPAKLGCAETPIGVPDADAAIAFATMLDGMEREEFEALEAACDRSLQFDVDACAAALGTIFDAQAPRLPPLEPDLIGEFFALEVLGRGEGFRGLRHPRLGEAAWRQRPDRMADFVRRAGQNFPNHRATQPLQVPIPGITESWRLRGYSLLLGAGTLDAGLVAVADALREAATQDTAAANAFAEIAIAVTALPDEATAPALRRSVLSDVAATADAHPAEPPLREQWATAANNYVVDRAAAEPEACRALLDAMRALADAHPAEPPLREQWATAANNYVADRAAAEPEACRALLDAMRALADAHPAELPLREWWVNAANNYVADRAAAEPEACRALLDAIRALADANPAEPPLRELWARAATNYVNRRAAAEPAACRALLDAIRALADANPAEPPLREWWAKAATNYVNRRAAAEAEACRALLDAMRALADANPAEPPLRELWAKAATNYVGHRAAAGAEACRALLDAMRALADANPAEPPLREWWARCNGAYIVDWRAQAPEETLRLVDAVAAVVEAHPGEDGLFYWHAMGAVQWLQVNGAAMLDARERVWQRLLQFAEGHEAVLHDALAFFEIELPASDADQPAC